MTEPSLFLLIPAYNEEHRIEPVLRDYARYFQEHYQGKFQLVVVLNGTHLYALNRGVLLTPFHNMALMCPATTEADVDLHTRIFGEAAHELTA